MWVRYHSELLPGEISVKYVDTQTLPLIAASHEDQINPGVRKRVIATQDDFQSGHVQMLNWAVLPIGSAFHRHYHEDMQEIFVLVRGSAEMQCGGNTIFMKPGDAVFVDAMEHHSMKNTGEIDVEYIVFGISSGRGGQTRMVSQKDDSHVD
jgi:mannose-6-phosphate isomerase-like protein (cupin superfamily)